MFIICDGSAVNKLLALLFMLQEYKHRTVHRVSVNITHNTWGVFVESGSELNHLHSNQ